MSIELADRFVDMLMMVTTKAPGTLKWTMSEERVGILGDDAGHRPDKGKQSKTADRSLMNKDENEIRCTLNPLNTLAKRTNEGTSR